MKFDPMRASFILMAAALIVPAAAQTSAVRKPSPTTLPAPTARESAPSPEQLVERARESLQAGDATRALALAQQARRADPHNYKPPYYVGLAMMALGEFDAALQAQRQSLALAQTPEQKQAVEALRTAIEAQQGVTEADSALQEGLDAKAARLYKAAFDAGAQRADIGLTAARLYEQRLKDIGTALRLLREVERRFPNSSAATKASGEIARLRPALAAVATEKLRAAQERAPGTRRAMLEEALALDSGNADVLFALANDAAADTANWPQLAASMKVLLQRRLLEEGVRSGKLRLNAWHDDARLRTLLEDAWGTEAAGQLLRTRGRSMMKFQLNRKKSDTTVEALEAGGPAQKGGIQVGDAILAMGGVPVSTVDDVLRSTASLPAGLPAAVLVRRGGQQHTVFVVPEDAPVQGDCIVLGSVGNYTGPCRNGLAQGQGRMRYKTTNGYDAEYVGGFEGGFLRGKASSTVSAPTGPVVLELLDGDVVKGP